MDQLGISAIHPTAPEMFSTAALYVAPIDLDAAVERLRTNWGEKFDTQWETIEANPDNPESPSGKILHFTIEGVKVMLTPVAGKLTVERGQLPQHNFYVAMTCYAPAEGATQGTLAGERDLDPSRVPNAAELRRRHRMLSAHIVYTEVADCLVRETAAIGIYRQELGVVHQPKMIQDLSQFLKQGQAPVPLWTNIRIHQPDLTIGRTLGLNLFGHLDLEVRESTKSGDDVYNMLANVANYIISGDTFLLPGQTVGYDAGTELAITQDLSPADQAPVIRIDY